MNHAKCIYVVDDDDEIRTLLKTYLEKHQFTVLTADSGEAFLADFRAEQNIDLVILDIHAARSRWFAVLPFLTNTIASPRDHAYSKF